MISKIRMFAFKSGANYQFDRRDDKLFERYLIRAEKAIEDSKGKAPTSADNHPSKRLINKYKT